MVAHKPAVQDFQDKAVTRAVTKPIVTSHSSQAERVFAKFGGVRRLAQVLAEMGRPKNLTTLYRWTYPKPRGTGGRIPSNAWRDLLLAATRIGLELTDEDTRPEELNEQQMEKELFS